MAVIYKLIWYQDGYEQPSEEDLKRIMSVSFKFFPFTIIFTTHLYFRHIKISFYIKCMKITQKINLQQNIQTYEDDDPTDLHFRHITEITILTVQLIVEFAKGLPAFTKIPQEDQITLLKVCLIFFL